MLSLRILQWINENNLLEVFNGRNWDNQSERLKQLNENHLERYSNCKPDKLFINLWTQNADGIREMFERVIDKYIIVALVQDTDRSLFSKVFIYLLLDLEEESLELKNIHRSFIHKFPMKLEELSYIKGCWCLDMLSHPKLIQEESANFQTEIFQQYAKDALQ